MKAGRNLGAQLFWQQQTFPSAFAATRWILPYPQYWGYRLTGIPSSEITSPAVLFSRRARSFAAWRTSSSISRVVRMHQMV